MSLPGNDMYPRPTIIMPTRVRSARLCAALLVLLVAASPALAQIPATEYAARRDSLAARVRNGVVVAFGGRTPVTDFGPFYQLPAFHYLTNFHEPDAAFVMVVRDGRGTSTLFLTPITFGMQARSFAALPAVLDSLAGARLPFLVLDDHESADFAAQDSLTRGKQFVRSFKAKHADAVEIRNGHPVVDELRARKSPAEMALIRRAAEISDEGHRAAMLAPQPNHEYEVQAALEGTFLRLGGARPGYGSIVGGGPNSLLLHYMRDRAAVKPGDVVLMDAATEYQGYSADVTRTIPVSGKYTPEQRAIYQLVLDAQKAAERNSKPGMSAPAAQDSSWDVRARGLAKLGLVESVDAELDLPWPADCKATPRACKQAMFWMIHGISHGIGLAVHDPAQFYAPDKLFKQGDAFTIEPGIYISRSMLDALPDTPRNRAFIAKVRPVVERYENTGVRIEDDYLITEKGLERISLAPREMEEIEALMAKRPPRLVP
jgi:Xaa-Pro aminopeptidase